MRSVLCLLLSFIGVAASQPRSWPQQEHVTIHFLNFKTLKPLGGLYVIVTFWKHKNEIPLSKNVIANISKKTDKFGEIQVDIPRPTPEEITVFTPGLVNYNVLDFSIADVMERGAVSRFPPAKSGEALKKPLQSGEIVILNRKETAWDRIKREFFP